MLEKCGYRATVAENGLEALEALTERSYAAVLMDCMMPELDGYETTRQIRRSKQAWRRVPVIAMTANSMRGERERCLAAGMDDYLTKPLRNQTLRDTLKRFVPEPEITPVRESRTRPRVATSGPDGLLDDMVIAELEFDGEALAELLGLYFDEADTQISEVSDALDRGDAHAIAQAAHKLKGNSASMGAARVARVASSLEVGARAGDLSVVAELLERLRAGLAETRRALGPLPPR
jgi:two-component system sensor histidine kinase/response regulator